MLYYISSTTLQKNPYTYLIRIHSTPFEYEEPVVGDKLFNFLGGNLPKLPTKFGTHSQHVSKILK